MTKLVATATKLVVQVLVKVVVDESFCVSSSY